MREYWVWICVSVLSSILMQDLAVVLVSKEVMDVPKKLVMQEQSIEQVLGCNNAFPNSKNFSLPV
jgi:hypothetical protein